MEDCCGKMTEENLESITQFHKQKGNCDCIQLMELWEQMEVVDKLAVECTKDAKEYNKNKEQLEKDEKWMLNFRYRLGRFHEETEKYRNLFLEKLKKGHVKLQSIDGVVTTFYSDSDKEDYNCYCASCSTRVPRLHYEGWNK